MATCNDDGGDGVPGLISGVARLDLFDLTAWPGSDRNIKGNNSASTGDQVCRCWDKTKCDKRKNSWRRFGDDPQKDNPHNGGSPGIPGLRQPLKAAFTGCSSVTGSFTSSSPCPNVQRSLTLPPDTGIKLGG
ncbi:hypothetical protein PoB_006630000 [Plakobranchus ocellatus]|uniref:Uncharacterized protein n=1 Tax=Plakobranchus ocellatus TaxID=259542 RepID=A0AAV4D726_9GAST|nr:hypothetical protein PoB_006630000 [Plakobranchus ocellatus]